MNQDHIGNLSGLRNLFEARQASVKKTINTLQLRQVADDTALTTTMKNIVDATLLTAVTIGEPKIKGHDVSERQGSQFGRTFAQEIFVITVEFPFTGSEELFNFRGQGQLSLSEIYKPEGNSIEVDVELHKLDKDAALTEANAMIAATRMLINVNNPEAERWSESIAPDIQTSIELKAKELKEFYS